MEDGKENTKKCTKCGKELPLSMFYERSVSSDGLQNWCKVCSSRQHRKTGLSQMNMIPSSVKKVWYLDKLADVSNKDLIAELKARGFRGLLKYEYEINV